MRENSYYTAVTVVVIAAVAVIVFIEHHHHQRQQQQQQQQQYEANRTELKLIANIEVALAIWGSWTHFHLATVAQTQTCISRCIGILVRRLFC